MQRKTMRILVTIGTPFAAVGLSMLLSIATDLLGRTLLGRIAMAAIFVGMVMLIARTVWTWPDWDDEQKEQTK